VILALLVILAVSVLLLVPMLLAAHRAPVTATDRLLDEADASLVHPRVVGRHAA
jgi:hypothetical protein